MKKVQSISYMLAFISCLSVVSSQAQSLSPRVIASAGGYSSNGAGSLSFTIGEANTKTLTSATHTLTQGFQQPFKMTLNLKAFIQGYYTSSGTMENVLFNEGVTPFSGNECDTIVVQLRQPTSPYLVVSESQSVIQTNGQLTFSGTAPIGQSYYVVLKHRNAVETWSANPVLLNENTLYDFSSAANKAFGDNMVEVEPGIWSLYSGDIQKDENVDLLDLGTLESDISNFTYGYFATDINGDGNVDLLDSPLLEENINAFVFSYHP